MGRAGLPGQEARVARAGSSGRACLPGRPNAKWPAPDCRRGPLLLPVAPAGLGLVLPRPGADQRGGAGGEAKHACSEPEPAGRFAAA